MHTQSKQSQPSKGKGFVREIIELFRSIPSLTVTIFIASTISMNLLANKSLDLNLNWLVADCGILVSWITFLTLDIVTRRFGPKAATILSVVGLGVNLFIGGLFFLASILPGVWGESYVPGSEDVINVALNHTFGGTWYILLGSSIAFLVSSVVNNFSNWYIGKALKDERGDRRSFLTYAARSYISTGIAQFADNLTFALLVSHRFFDWTLSQCIACAFLGALMELACEVVFSPIGYRISRSWAADHVGDAYIRKYVRPEEDKAA